MTKISSVIVGAAGEYHVLSQLLRRGWIAALAPDGAPNMDILVTDESSNRLCATRKVLAWRISNTLEAEFCVEALNEAIHRFGPPEIMNTDQGSQFTSFAWTDRLKRVSTKISMDGKGRFLDNIFVERLWRSLKYECVYLHAWETGSEAKAGVRKWMDFYNRKRPHSALGGRPPAVVYWQRNETVKPDQQEQRVA